MAAREDLGLKKRRRRATEDSAAAREASLKLADLYTNKTEEYCSQQGTNISNCFWAAAFAEAWRLINRFSGRKPRPTGMVEGTAEERKSRLRGHFEGPDGDQIRRGNGRVVGQTCPHLNGRGPCSELSLCGPNIHSHGRGLRKEGHGILPPQRMHDSAQ